MNLLRGELSDNAQGDETQGDEIWSRVTLLSKQGLLVISLVRHYLISDRWLRVELGTEYEPIPKSWIAFTLVRILEDEVKISQDRETS